MVKALVGLVPVGVEEIGCLSMGEDIEEAQKFSMDAAEGRQDGTNNAVCRPLECRCRSVALVERISPFVLSPPLQAKEMLLLLLPPLVFVFFNSPIGASGVDPGRIEFKPGDQPIHNTLLPRLRGPSS